MKMCIVGNDMENIMEAVRAYKDEATKPLHAEIEILVDEVRTANVINDALEGECEILLHAFRKAQAELEEKNDLVKELQKELERANGKLSMMTLAFEMGLSGHDLDALLDATSMDPMPSGYAKHFDRSQEELAREEQPACCAAGHCGTEKCGGCCHGESETPVIAFPGPDGKLLLAYKVTRG